MGDTIAEGGIGSSETDGPTDVGIGLGIGGVACPANFGLTAAESPTPVNLAEVDV